jgi:hypothetical protein
MQKEILVIYKWIGAQYLYMVAKAQGHLLYSNDENFEKLVYGWFFIIFHKLLIDFA